MLASPSADVGEGVRVLVNVGDVALRAENRLQDVSRAESPSMDNPQRMSR